MKAIKNLLGVNRKNKKPASFYQGDRNRFSKSMPGETGALASIRLTGVSL